jgi:NTE family protein
MKYYKNIKEFNSKIKYSQLNFIASLAKTYNKHTIVPILKLGSTLNKQGLVDSNDISAYYHLGGLFNISGRPTYNKTGDEMIFGSLNYRYSVISNQFLSSITSEAYLGCSLEAGKTWYKRYENLNKDDFLMGSSVYLAIDTVLGPFYLAYGYSDTNHQTVYFSLGKSY